MTHEPEEIKLQPDDKTKLRNYQKNNYHGEPKNVEESSQNHWLVNDFEIMKTTGLIQNIKSLHNTNKELLQKGITIYRDGKNYNMFDVSTIDVSINIIAANLSKLCRYSGNTRKFYSVAEHSIEVSRALLLNYGNVKLALAGLLHDSSEAFLNDILYTIKKEMGKDSLYAKLEENVEEHIYKTYEIKEYLNNPIVKHIDVQTCNLEFETLLSNKFSESICNIPTMNPAEAEIAFLRQYNLLTFLLSEYGDKECLCEIGSHKPKEI